MKYTEWIILSAVFVMFCLFGGLVFRSIDREHDKAENAAMAAEVEQLSQKMERLIETERRRVPSYMAYTPPPMIVQGVQWEADLHVRLQYLRWQIEFFVMLNNLEQKQRGHRIGQGVGQIIGDSKG